MKSNINQQPTDLSNVFDSIGLTYLPADSMQVPGVITKSIDEIIEWICQTMGFEEVNAQKLIEWLIKNEYKFVPLSNCQMWLLLETKDM